MLSKIAILVDYYGLYEAIYFTPHSGLITGAARFPQYTAET